MLSYKFFCAKRDSKLSTNLKQRGSQWRRLEFVSVHCALPVRYKSVEVHVVQFLRAVIIHQNVKPDVQEELYGFPFPVEHDDDYNACYGRYTDGDDSPWWELASHLLVVQLVDRLT